MKIKYIFIAIITCITKSYTQDACNNLRGNYNQILSELNKRNTSQDQNKLTQSHLESIAKYWVAVCKCEKGTSDENLALELSNVIFENKSHYTDNYISKGKIYKKNLSLLGGLKPNNKIYTQNSCLNTHNRSIETIEEKMGCTIEAKNFLNNADDKQQFGKAFYRAYCECISGASSRRIPDLVKDMKINHKNYHLFKSANDPTIETLPLDAHQCKSKNINQNGISKNQTMGLLIDDDFEELLKELSSISNNSNFKIMVDKISSTRNEFGKARNFYNKLGILQNSDEFNFVENLTVSVEIIKGIYNIISDIPTPEETAAKSSIDNLNYLTKSIYDEINHLPTYYDYNSKMIEDIEKIENRIIKYEKTTLVNRLVILKYLNTDYRMTIQELNSIKTDLEKKYKQGEIYNLKKKITNYKDSYSNPINRHLANTDYGFGRILNKIYNYKIKYYKSIGDKKKVTENENKINFNVSNIDAFNLLIDSYNDKNYNSTIKYYEKIKQYLIEQRTNKNITLVYNNINNGVYKNQPLKRVEAVVLLSMGCLSYIKQNNLKQAKIELLNIKKYNDELNSFIGYYKGLKTRKKYGQYSETELTESYGHCIAIEKTIEAVVLSNEIDEINSNRIERLLSEALHLFKKHPILSNPYIKWIKFNKIDILIKLNKLTEAKRVIMKIKKSYHLKEHPLVLFSDFDILFYKALISYKEGNIRNALNTIKIMEISNKSNTKIKLLKLKIQKNDK